MSSSKIDNTTINRIFDYILEYNYTSTPVEKLQKKLRCKYAATIEENKRRIEELEKLTTIDLL